MMRACISIIGYIIFVLPMSSSAQDYVDLLKISYDQIQPVGFENENDKAGFNEFFVDGTLPIPIKKHAIITGFQYENFNLKAFPDTAPLNFQSLMIKAGVNINHSEKWSGNYVLLPKVMGQNLGIDNFQIGLISILSYKKSEYFKYKFGFYANDEFFGTLLVPVFGLYYRKNNWEANLNLPINATVNYKLNDKSEGGLTFQGIKKSYNVESMYQGESVYLEKSNNEIGLYYQYDIKGIQLRAEAGSSILRTFKIFAQGDLTDLTISAINIGDNRNQLNPSFPNGIYAKFSIYYRLFLDKK